MIIHVKPDKNHNPTYIYEDEPVNRHPDLPPGAITIGDIFHFLGRAIKWTIKAIITIITICLIIGTIQTANYYRSQDTSIDKYITSYQRRP